MILRAKIALYAALIAFIFFTIICFDPREVALLPIWWVYVMSIGFLISMIVTLVLSAWIFWKMWR